MAVLRNCSSRQTNHEKSAEVIVGVDRPKDRTTISCKNDVCPEGLSDNKKVCETYMSEIEEVIGYTQGSGKRRSTQEMSELLEKILSRSNVGIALDRVCANKGAAGIDGITVQEVRDYMNANWKSIKQQIREGLYKPWPVRRVRIPKPDGSKRNLGIPTVVDRIIQQAIAQVISPMCEPIFSDHSYGFRPNRSCEQAMIELLGFLNEGYTWIVDFDLEKFFDRVPQDRLMSYVHNIINDGDTESLIRKFLKAGVMDDGRFERSEMGTPQGGNLSPLLANIMLNQLDHELESRGLRFVRYADDFVVAVASNASATRVMYSVTSWIETKLGMKVNTTKTQIKRPSNVKFLGFSFWKDRKTGQWRLRPHQDSVKKFKKRLKALTKRNSPMTMSDRIRLLNYVIRGWINYFARADMKTAMAEIDAHLRTRIRMIFWKQWKTPANRYKNLKAREIGENHAKRTSYWGNHYFLVATKSCLVTALSKARLAKENGLVSCVDYYAKRHALKYC